MKLTLFIILFISSAAIADWQDQCKTEIGKYCPGKTHSSHLGMYACLNESLSSLGYDCRAKIKETAAALQKAEQGCQEDIHKSCETVPPGGGAWLRCLRKKGEELSTTCKEALKNLDL